MFFPFSTDAPLYHLPVATVGVIVANLLVFLGMWAGTLNPDAGWALVHGDGLHPTQWLLSMFAHADAEHLLGNMFFLWVFGLVVEGKLGWLRFLACYLTIGVGESAVEQLLFLGADGPSASLGASTAIYGLMAMAAVWAPKNEVTFFYWVVFFFGTFDVAIGFLAALYVGFDLLVLVLLSGQMSTQWLHVAGAVVGFPLGVVLLKRGVVDCEGWDVFHVWRGEYGSIRDTEEQDLRLSKQFAVRQAEWQAELAETGKERVHEFLAAGNSDAAEKLVNKLHESGVDPGLDATDLAALINAMHQRGRWAKSAPLMAKLIQLAPDRADPVRIKLAQICVVELNRPGRALDLLGEVNAAALPAAHRELAVKIARRAEQVQASGYIEIDDDGWAPLSD